MKKLLKISLIAVSLLFSASLYASEGSFVLKVKSVDEKLVTFYIDEAQNVDVSIYGGENELVYEKRIKAKGASTKTYDLSSFPDGSYTFKMATESKVTEYKILIEQGKTLVSNPVIIEKFKPVLTKENNTITLNLENAAKGPIELRILNEYNDQLYNEVFEGEATVIKRFNVSKVGLGDLIFLIKSDNQEFSKVVQMR
ncbi:MAG: hypothetical protein P0Y49_02380 [Candidatus Pedobacter colombiensis]|uniref:Por secretion system C-terminal sorting domain-containing protein n=1 Tax=Candidatus Pedobacter colombiensis TaxID=3121371 RepID=A0AAJ5W9A6_9SPHI|nr:hypothetical protein [Pedobacter sp.]WEK20000.1 MAG: hypothetical protein P0Y49_02380 [Pedobacter sp.]